MKLTANALIVSAPALRTAMLLLAFVCLTATAVQSHGTAFAEEQATAIVVTTDGDELNGDGDCSLREAIAAANTDKAVSGCAAGSGANDIIQLQAVTYTLEVGTLGGLRLRESAIVRGASGGGTVVDGGNSNATLITVDYDELFVCDATNNRVLRFSSAGNLAGTFIAAGSGGLSLPNGIVAGTYDAIDDYVYVSGFTSGIKRYDRLTGAYVDTLSTAGSSGTFAPTALTIGPGGIGANDPDFNLYATNYQPSGGGNVPGIWRFNPAGGFIDVFVPTPYLPNSIVFGPDKRLYATDPTNHKVLRYNGKTGALIDTFVAAASGGLQQPRGLVFGPDDNLYVASELTNQILRYNGSTGASLGAFVAAGSGGLSKPTALTFGPDGNLYVLSSGTKSILRYSGANGQFLDEFVAPGEGGLGSPSCLAFMDGVGDGPTVQLTDLTIQNGGTGVRVAARATAVLRRNTIRDNDGGFGGGLTNLGVAQVFDTTIQDNDSFNFGGGVYNSGTLQMGTSTIAGNYAPVGGGGIANSETGTVSLYNVTISGNRTDRAGGGIANFGTTVINNSTIVQNAADSESSAGDYSGGGIYNDPGAEVRMRNSILAQNTDYPANATEGPDCGGELQSYKHNVIGNNKNCAVDDPDAAGTPNDQIGTSGTPVDPRLQPLALNGGPTATHALLSNSPARDQGSPTQNDFDAFYACRTRDQRGFPRSAGGRCDVGAFEVVSLPLYLPLVLR